MANNTYTMIGHLTVVPAADVADKDSAINALSDARLGSDGCGKHPGMMILMDNGAGDYDLLLALSAAPTGKWLTLCNTGGSGVTPS